MEISELSNTSLLRKIQKQKEMGATQNIDGKIEIAEPKMEKWVQMLHEMPDIRDIEVPRAVPKEINKILAEKIANQIV